jgi:hypothetical protein
MIEVQPAPHMRRVVEDTLRARLSALGATAAPHSIMVAALNPEDSLCRLMVTHRPNIRRKRRVAADEKLLGDIAAVAGKSHWNDLRFIDALNALYEAWDEGYMPEARTAFLHAYADAIERMLAVR